MQWYVANGELYVSAFRQHCHFAGNESGIWTLLNTGNSHTKAREAMYSRLQKDLPDLQQQHRRAIWPLGRFQDIRPALAHHFANVSASTGPPKDSGKPNASPFPSLTGLQTQDPHRSQRSFGSIADTESGCTNLTSTTPPFSFTQRSTSYHDSGGRD